MKVVVGIHCGVCVMGFLTRVEVNYVHMANDAAVADITRTAAPLLDSSRNGISSLSSNRRIA